MPFGLKTGLDAKILKEYCVFHNFTGTLFRNLQ